VRAPNPWSQIVQLVALKLRLTYRLYLRSPLALFGLLMSIGFMTFASFGALFFCLLLFEVLREPQRTELLYLLLAALYLVWVTAPLFGVSLNEGYDLSKLFVFPIPYSRVFLGSVLGNLLDPPVVMLAPALTAAVVGFGHTPLQMMAIALLLALFVVHTVSLSQLLQLVMWGFLRSRRVRDLVLVIGPVITMLLYFGQVMLFRRSWAKIGWLAMLWEAQPSKVLQFFPCGMVATGIQAASDGRWPGVLLQASLLATLCAATIAGAAWLVRQLHAGESEMGRLFAWNWHWPAFRRDPRRGRRRRSWLHPVVRAMALKELRYLVRDPHWKAYLIRSLAPTVLYPFFMIAAAPRGLRANVAETLDVTFFTVPTGALLFSTLILNANVFAIDRTGLYLLFQFSCPRRLLLLGKNLATASITGGVLVLLLLLVAATTRRGDLLVVSLVGASSLMLLFLGAGNLLSIFFPHRLPNKNEPPMQTSAGRGCLMMLVNALAYVLVLTVATPPLLALALPYTFGAWGVYWVALPAVVIYCVGLYGLTVWFAGGWLQRREIELLQAIRGD